MRSGVVANQQVKTASGVEALDRAAAEVAEVMRFDPAKNRGEETAAWISQWFTFQIAGSPSAQRGGAPADRPLELSDLLVTGVVVTDLDHDGATDVYVRRAYPGTTPIIVVDGEIQGRPAGERWIPSS